MSHTLKFSRFMFQFSSNLVHFLLLSPAVFEGTMESLRQPRKGKKDCFLQKAWEGTWEQFLARGPVTQPEWLSGQWGGSVTMIMSMKQKPRYLFFFYCEFVKKMASDRHRETQVTDSQTSDSDDSQFSTSFLNFFIFKVFFSTYLKFFGACGPGRWPVKKCSDSVVHNFEFPQFFKLQL